MNKEKRNSYINMINTKTLSAELLLSAIACIDKKTSKLAYTRGRFKNCPHRHEYDAINQELIQNINHRKKCIKVLETHRPDLKSQSLDVARVLEQDDIISWNVCEQVILLMDSGNYSIV